MSDQDKEKPTEEKTPVTLKDAMESMCQAIECSASIDSGRVAHLEKVREYCEQTQG